MKKTNPMSVASISSIARNMRKEFNIGENEFFPIFDVLERYHYQEILTIQILDNDNEMMDDDVLAVYNPIDNFIYIKESVLEDLDNNNYRANFTLAHELFHFIQFKVLEYSFEEVESCKDYCNAEWQANEFAGQLLIPDSYVSREDYNYEEAAKLFHTTEECAITRKLYYRRRQKRKNDNKKMDLTTRS